MLTYLGPKEVLVNQPIVLVGTYDPQQIKTVSVVAEDKYPLNVTLNPKAGIWHVSLERGFNTTGERWLRLRGQNRPNQTVGDQIFRLIVELEGVNIGAPFNVIALRETLVKQQAIDSSRLSSQQKQIINAGQVIGIDSYNLSYDHLEVNLSQALPNFGKSGYFYQPHVLVAKGGQILWFDREDLPPTPPGTKLLWVTRTTAFKRKPQDTSQLGSNQWVELPHGMTYTILGYASVMDHFRVTLNREIPGFGKIGYIYRYHAEIWQQNQQISYNSNTLNLTVISTTPLKKRPVDAAYLPANEKVTLPATMVYGVQSYATEAGHLKVALTENFPQFGNTGYVYPDFVELTRGSKAFSPALPITYQGPLEVVVGQPTTLKGTFDPNKVANISLMAEDRYKLEVTLNSRSGKWEVALPKGFSEAGYRWFRLKALNKQRQLVASEVVRITVSANPMTIGESLTLTLTEDTLFKVAPFDSNDLNSTQQIALRAGQTFKVVKYGLVDGHLKVLFDNAIPPVGTFGYFYKGHVQLRKGTDVLRFEIDQVPDTDISAQMWVIKTTKIKAQPIDSDRLSPKQIDLLLLGETYAITGYACTQGHFRITLAEAITGFGNVGYVYWQHIQIVRNGKEIPYNPDAITMTIGKGTLLKKRPVDSNRLSSSESVKLPTGRVYGVSSYGIENNHVKVALTEEFLRFGNTGYVFPGHVQFQRGGKTFNPIPDQVELNVPYFSQRDNPRFSWATCNVTTIAMVFYYYGVRSQWGSQLEDELLQWTFNYAGVGSQTSHNVLSDLIRAYGFKTSFSTTRRWSEVKQEIINRRPVILPGDMTAEGHIVTVIGYNKQGYIVHDPWGDAYTGYTNTEGRRLLYSYSYLDRVSGPDGNVWAHFIEP